MTKKRGIVWFRQDLRLHDNEPFGEAIKNFDEIIPVFVFDDRLLNRWPQTPFPKIFRTRLKFLIESVENLRKRLRARGMELYVRKGITEDIIYELAREYETSGVFSIRDRMPEGEWLQNNVEVKLWSLGQELHLYQGKMLFHTSDLPFPIARMPDLFSSFRKETLQFVPVREPYDVPEEGCCIPDVDIAPGSIPELSDYGYYSLPENEFTGGEEEGLLHLYDMKSQAEQGFEGGLEVSPWLAVGSLSARKVYHEINELSPVSEKVKRDWINKLMLRDYYRLISSREPIALFRAGGLVNEEIENRNQNEEDLMTWIRGETGEDFIDACMKCLFHTGYLNHEKRKAVARYFLEKMELKWYLGAGYFESVLIDYDPCLNYGNWQRQAGLSFDLKGVYSFNLENIREAEDPDGSFTEKWKNRTIDFDFLDQEMVV